MRAKLAVRWDVEAVNELKDIYDSIKNQSPQNALYVANTLWELGESLGLFPEKYPIDRFVSDSGIAVRSVSKWSFKIMYEVTNEAVIIISIINTNNNPKTLYENFE
jgi:plasmid stabilization system protein ParE